MDVDVMGYIAWAQENPNRYIDIEVERGQLSVWAWDCAISHGRHVVAGSVIVPASEIDLVAHKQAEEKRSYDALKKKFEGGNN